MTRPGESKAKRIALWVIAILVLGPGCYGFTAKLIQFIRTLKTVEGGDFTVIPIMNYFLVAAGLTCLLIWAIVHGMFRNIEEPKYKMLEREAELDRRDGYQWE